MARRVWKFTVHDKPHVVDLHHNMWTTGRIIKLDGRIVVDELPIDNLRHEYQFHCGTGLCEVVVGRSYLTLFVRYELKLNGTIIEPENLK